jgi:hypothetical protein
MLQGHPGWSKKEGGVPMSNKPERVFQHGGVKAVQRVYRDKEGKFKTTNSLYVNDLPKAILVLQKAFDYLTVRHEPEDVSTSF